LFSSSQVVFLLSLSKNEFIILFFINILVYTKRLKNNLSESNKKLRDVNTKRKFDDNQTVRPYYFITLNKKGCPKI